MNYLQNLSPRERKLVLMVAAILPLFILFWGFRVFTTTYFERVSKKRNLQMAIDDQNSQIDAMAMAQQRRLYYAAISVPANGSQAQIDYRQWLISQMEKAKMRVDNVAFVASTEKIRYREGSLNTEIGEQYTCKANAAGTLDQIVLFLENFNRLNLLHRIQHFKMRKVENETTRSEGVQLINFELTVQILRLVDSPTEREFLADQNIRPVADHNLAKSVKERNFFGLANNPPKITTSNRELRADEEVSFEIRADDPDKDHLLSWELLETNIPNGKLVQESPQDRSAIFSAEGLPVGEYEVKVRVTDSGLPAKSVEKSLAVVIKPPRVEPPRETPPKFKFATTTYLTGFHGDVLWVNNKAQDDLKFVKVGETFELDDETWKVLAIESRERIVIQRGSEILIYRTGATLDSPLSKKTDSEVSDKALSPESSTAQNTETADDTE